MTHSQPSWSLWTLAQTQPSAGAPTPAQASQGQPVNPVGVPGSSPAVPATGSPTGSQALPATSSTGQGGLGSMFWLFPILLIVMILMTTMAGRKDKKKKAELMSSLKKSDRVQMIGGEIGTVAEISDDEVVLKFDEGRIRYARSAVQAILSSSKAKGESGQIAEVKGESKTAAV
jgi:preprotein translocase subunit YajC